MDNLSSNNKSNIKLGFGLDSNFKSNDNDYGHHLQINIDKHEISQNSLHRIKDKIIIVTSALPYANGKIYL